MGQAWPVGLWGCSTLGGGRELQGSSVWYSSLPSKASNVNPALKLQVPVGGGCLYLFLEEEGGLFGLITSCLFQQKTPLQVPATGGGWEAHWEADFTKVKPELLKRLLTEGWGGGESDSFKDQPVSKDDQLFAGLTQRHLKGLLVCGNLCTASNKPCLLRGFGRAPGSGWHPGPCLGWGSPPPHSAR